MAPESPRETHWDQDVSPTDALAEAYDIAGPGLDALDALDALDGA